MARSSVCQSTLYSSGHNEMVHSAQFDYRFHRTDSHCFASTEAERLNLFHGQLSTSNKRPKPHQFSSLRRRKDWNLRYDTSILPTARILAPEFTIHSTSHIQEFETQLFPFQKCSLKTMQPQLIDINTGNHALTVSMKSTREYQ